MMSYSVLPPPPRVPMASGYGGAAATYGIPIETNNLLTHPEEQFFAGDGAYILKDELQLATPPPHPSEAAPPNPNPLATAPRAVTGGTRLSLLRFESHPLSTRYSGVPDPSSTNGYRLSSQQHQANGNRTSKDVDQSDSDAAVTHFRNSHQGSVNVVAPIFGHSNPLLAPPVAVKDASKRRKPKTGTNKSNSSLISRVINHDQLPKKLQDRPQGGLLAFANVNRAFQWLDLDSSAKNDYLCKMLFTKAHCICHDVNQVTKSASHIDVIMGCSTGEIIWWEPVSQKYSRINKNGIINKTPVLQIKWLPGSENLFVAAHMNSTLVVYDKEKEDAVFELEEQAELPDPFRPPMQILKSVNSKNQKSNPVAAWQFITPRSEIKDFAFAPDARHLAIVSEDGSLRILNFIDEHLTDHLHSWYGSYDCVAWSPDGKYILAGGHDEPISIWLVSESLLVALCEGHQNWVKSVAFDPWRCENKNYRFGSIGLDRRLCLWDFNLGMLPRSQLAANQGRGSIASGMMLEDELNGDAQSDHSSDEPRKWPRPIRDRKDVPKIPPVSTKVLDEHPFEWLGFTEDNILTACAAGQIRTWERPQKFVPGQQHLP